ncbi:hypothetical protein SADUNF_Sadunf06G0059800 [Salix dunnii]|uniref:Uncharacterized protein n=1 Tax=Salix dunnii TaxID=1413687 RepID=A0A835K195_9ROSI|nr:hypothetical protein SADUNF_Sadunf06G0059800 [Salix dunnii]
MEFERQWKWICRESSLKYISGNYTGANISFGTTDYWSYEFGVNKQPGTITLPFGGDDGDFRHVHSI